MKTFISYSSRDRADALEIRRILVEQGCEVWLDAFDINPSKNLEEELSQNIRQAEVFCLLLSPTSVSSGWVGKEIASALEQRHHGLRILPVLLRPCLIPDAIKGITALSVSDGYEGLKNDHVRYRLIRAVLGENSVEDVLLDDAYQKYLGDVARQEEAARVLPELTRQIDRVREMPIRELGIELDHTIFDSSIYRENPFILELRLHLNELLSAPISFFFAPFQEGHTWPEAFGFDEPLNNDFGPDQARVDGRLKWFDRVEVLSGAIDATDLHDLPASFDVRFDGSDFNPQDSSDDPFHGNVPALRQKYEIPSLKELVNVGSAFELIAHWPASQTAEQVTPEILDVDLQVYASFGKQDVHLALYHSRHTELEKILLSGNYLSNITNLIERECALNLLPHAVQDDKVEKRLRAHRLRAGLEDPDSDEDRRMAASLIADRNGVLAQRGRSLKICAWDEMPGVGEQQMRSFLQSESDYRDFFSYLIFHDPKEIETARFKKDSPDQVTITTGDRSLIIRLGEQELDRPDLFFAGVFFQEAGKDERHVHDFLVQKEKRRLFIYQYDRLNLIEGCMKMCELLEPLVFERQPSYRDGYLLKEATITLADHFTNIKTYENATQYAVNAVAIGARMYESNPAEGNYARWQADGYQLLGKIAIQTGELEKAKEYLRNCLSILRDMYNALPNIERHSEWVEAMETARELLPKRDPGVQDEIKSISSELKQQGRLRSQIDLMVKSLQIEIGSYRLDILTKMAKRLKVAQESASRYTEHDQVLIARPKKTMEDEEWQAVNKILRKYGYEWVNTLETRHDQEHWEGHWEKWIRGA